MPTHSAFGTPLTDLGMGALGNIRLGTMNRRQALGTLAGTSAGVAAACSLRAETSPPRAKQVLFIWLDGAMSQLESWDPKPGTQFGGPFQGIQTQLPGVVLSELMPQMALRMDRFSIVRGMHTKYEDHSKGVIPIQQGDPKNRGVTYPLLGSAVVKLRK